MNDKEIKRLEDYLSSLKGEVIIKCSSTYFDNKSDYLLLSKIENGKMRGQILGPYGATIISLDILAKEGFEIANFKGIKKVLKEKSKK